MNATSILFIRIFSLSHLQLSERILVEDIEGINNSTWRFLLKKKEEDGNSTGKKEDFEYIWGCWLYEFISFRWIWAVELTSFFSVYVEVNADRFRIRAWINTVKLMSSQGIFHFIVLQTKCDVIHAPSLFSFFLFFSLQTNGVLRTQ